ncbi:DNA repair exonuclease SbcCD nuclease subunit [Rhodothalassium salexigens DSM 2132]|uniref:DNA repair exonuclease SbcCD nuclease subunit n=1 Tax=Rhodothalassium salexigens DSM 2132 TaxID=1188247 RepID=A0A4R2PPP9_RHOSA|nr:DNA repair exonuclease [Rhodothalassium salexigens]MBB4210692.1 DNA repair exonuclease SbcCD nuclease subunit [Rhodothalassium salexigens DSM 2132]MBK1637893.1 hypothetical protein [Rhodothalassium salexigens DSM 2132]TCP37752.1 DNA repair exonuclease SbcCD nuclease subunit [Rhodothalassium salexigens DSM 2132]
MSFRFLHTADVHLDSPLRSLSLRDAEAGRTIANATRQSFARIVDLCLEEQVDALLIAGDLYDGDLRSMKTAAFLTGQMRRLTDAGIAVCLIQGNHDAASVVTRDLAWPEGVFQFPPDGGTVALQDGRVAVHGVSFARPQAPHSLLPVYPAPVAGAINVGLLHTSLAGSAEHDTYAPCALADLLAHGYDYWALGHIHKRMVHAEAPVAVVMPGIPQGRHINEAGVKTVTLAEIDDDGRTRLAERVVAPAQFERVAVDLDGLAQWSALPERLEAALAEARAGVAADHLVARLTLTGATGLAARLVRDADMVVEEATEAGRRVGGVLIDRLDNRTEPAGRDDGAVETKAAADALPLAELGALLRTPGPGRERVAAEVADQAAGLQRKLPPEVRDRLLDPAADDPVAAYLDTGAQAVLARLTARGSADPESGEQGGGGD